MIPRASTWRIPPRYNHEATTRAKATKTLSSDGQWLTSNGAQCARVAGREQRKQEEILKGSTALPSSSQDTLSGLGPLQPVVPLGPLGPSAPPGPQGCPRPPCDPGPSSSSRSETATRSSARNVPASFPLKYDAKTRHLLATSSRVQAYLASGQAHRANTAVTRQVKRKQSSQDNGKRARCRTVAPHANFPAIFERSQLLATRFPSLASLTVTSSPPRS